MLNHFIKTTLSAICFLAAISISQAQIVGTTGYTADEIAGYLAGPGVEIDNVEIDCHNLAFGLFDCIDCSIDLDSGIVLTSGFVSNITGPNNSGSTGSNNGWPGDPDLNALPGGPSYNACALEFDVYSPGDSLKFSYIFGSDEYPEWVGGTYNDAFKFYISGPGIPVPTNIALIPGTVLPVSINNVNEDDYSEYYIMNGSGATGGGMGVYAVDPYYVEYDAFTTELVAESAVTPCEWYHLKLVIGDKGDQFYDSGVFLKAKSLVTATMADFTYPGVPFDLGAFFCSTEPDPEPMFAAGATAGEFTAEPPGMVYDPLTGVIDLDASIPGTYEFTNTLVVGFCDIDTAVYTVNITITDPPIATFSYLGSPFCDNETNPSPLLFPGASLGTFTAPAGLVIDAATGVIDLDASTPGTYTVTNYVSGELVCPDASATYSVTIYPTYSSLTNASVCDGDPYVLPDGTAVFAAGLYATVLDAVTGCDSTINTILTILPVYTATVSANICSGATYTLPDGTDVTTAGTYNTILPSADGCDSTIITELTVSLTATSEAEVHMCDGETYVLPDGDVVDDFGIYYTTLATADGCDSVITTYLHVHPVFSYTIDAEICSGETYTLPDGTTATVSGTYFSNLFTLWGCDSVYTTNLTVHPAYDIVMNPEICDGESYILPDGVSQSTSDIFNYAYTTINGCDSAITVNLTVHPLPVISWTIDDIICIEEGDILLGATPAGGTYSGTGVAGTEFNPATAGVGGPYTLTYDYTDIYGCSSSMTVETSVDDNYALAWGDTTVYYGDDANLSGDAGGDYNWSPPDGIECLTCPQTAVTSPYTIDYILTSVDENGCTATDNAMITVMPDPGNILYIPNTFTPNGDNINDIFFVFGWNLIAVNSIQVFDRWGELVYYAENLLPGDVSKGWDGTFNGQVVNNGVYAYMVEVQFETGQHMSQMGNVTVIR